MKCNLQLAIVQGNLLSIVHLEIVLCMKIIVFVIVALNIAAARNYGTALPPSP